MTEKQMDIAGKTSRYWLARGLVGIPCDGEVEWHDADGLPVGRTRTGDGYEQHDNTPRFTTGFVRLALGDTVDLRDWLSGYVDKGAQK